MRTSVPWTSRSPAEIGSYGRVSYGKTYVDVSFLLDVAIYVPTVNARCSTASYNLINTALV